MAFFEKFCHLAYWQQLFSSEFNCGYFAALALVFAVFAVLLVLKILLWLFFRTRRCGSITMKYPDGEVVVSRDAVTALLQNELRDFSQLEVESIRIYRRGEMYYLHLNADFLVGGKGLQEVLDEAKPRLLAALEETLGITNVKKIKVVIHDLGETDGEESSRSGSRSSGLPTVRPESAGE